MTNYWQGKAACAQYRPSRWDTDEPDPQALAICDACPVKDTCLQDALDRNELHGVRGGLTPAQRLAMRRGRAISNADRTRMCRDCTGIFTPPFPRSLYCSNECRDRSRREQARDYELRNFERRRRREQQRPPRVRVGRRRVA